MKSSQPSTSGSRLFKASIASQSNYFVQALKNMGFGSWGAQTHLNLVLKIFLIQVFMDL